MKALARIFRFIARRFVRRAPGFARARSGVAATEFAFILPIMTLLFFGMVEISDAMMANRRVTTAANSLADLVAQERQINTAQIAQVMTGVERMLEPSSGSSVTMTLVSVLRDPDDPDKVIVDWSRNNSGQTPYAKNSVYTKIDAGMVHESASLIVVEMDYQHVSGLTHHVIHAPMSLQRTVSRWPRQSEKVTLCGSHPLPACIGS